MKLTKKKLIETIESEGIYKSVKIDSMGNCTGKVIDLIEYEGFSGYTGRVFLGYDTELLSSLIESGKLSRDIKYDFI